jgi:hypothetical protein
VLVLALGVGRHKTTGAKILPVAPGGSFRGSVKIEDTRRALPHGKGEQREHD